MIARTKNTAQIYLGRYPAPIVVTAEQGKAAAIAGEQWASMFLRVDLDAIASYARGAILSRGGQMQFARGAIVLLADRTLAEPKTYG